MKNPLPTARQMPTILKVVLVLLDELDADDATAEAEELADAEADMVVVQRCGRSSVGKKAGRKQRREVQWTCYAHLADRSRRSRLVEQSLVDIRAALHNG